MDTIGTMDTIRPQKVQSGCRNRLLPTSTAGLRRL